MPKHKAKLSKGIYRDDHGIRAVVNIAAGRKEKRFDADIPLADIKRWRNVMKVKLERLHPQRRAGALGRGTFAAAAKRYIGGLAISSWKSRRSELRAWEREFGKTKRARINEDHIRKTVKKWVNAGTPPKTILNRVRALTAMYHTLDGADAWTPADDVALPKLVKKRKPWVDPTVISTVEENLRKMTAAGTLIDGAKWRARFMVLAACGARPTFVRRTKPENVDVNRRIWGMAAAKDGEPIELFLNDEMLAAWEAFIDADAWGPFDESKYAQIVREAGWPAHIKPYATKHTVGRELGERGVDFQVIADWFGHTDAKTTRESYVPVLNSQIRKASELMNGRLPWKPQSGRLLIIETPQSEADRQDAIVALLEQIKTALGLAS